MQDKTMSTHLKENEWQLLFRIFEILFKKLTSSKAVLLCNDFARYCTTDTTCLFLTVGVLILMSLPTIIFLVSSISLGFSLFLGYLITIGIGGTILLLLLLWLTFVALFLYVGICSFNLLKQEIKLRSPAWSVQFPSS